LTKSWLNHSRGEGIRDSMEQYQTLREKHQAAYDKLNKRYTIVSWLRLVVALALAMSVYQYFQEENTILLIISFLCLVGFLALLKFHSILLNKKNFEKALVEINEDEIAYLRGESIPFHKGEEFVDQKHLFSYDLDFFGEHSLFHNLNRTATYFGKTHFKDQLLNLLTIDEIRLNQSALKELAKKLELRQKMRAFGKLAQDNKKEYDALLNWSNDKPENINQAWVFLGYILPVIFSISTIIYFLSYNPLAFAIFKFSFFANLGFLAVHLKQIRKELINGDGMARGLQQYGLIIQQLEGIISILSLKC